MRMSVVYASCAFLMGINNHLLGLLHVYNSTHALLAFNLLVVGGIVHIKYLIYM